jgi:transcription elongation factor GreA
MQTMTVAGSRDDTLITEDGYDHLEQELRELVTQGRRTVADRLRQARADGGDPAENRELIEALDEGAFLEQRIGELRGRLATARIVRDAGEDGTAGVGTRVELAGPVGVVEYELVGAGEADPSRSRISIGSPVGQVVAGRRAGDDVVAEAPGGRVRYRLLAVEPRDGRPPPLAA